MSRFFKQKLPRLEFFGVQTAVHNIPLISRWLHQSISVQIFLVGRIDADPTLSPGNYQEVGYNMDIFGFNGQAQDSPGAKTNLGTQLDQLAHGLSGPVINVKTTNLDAVHNGGTQFITADALDSLGGIWEPVIALQISKIYEEDADPTLAGIPVFVTGQVLYEVE